MKRDSYKKVISVCLSIILLLQSLLPIWSVNLIFAQEETPQPELSSPTPEPVVDSTPFPSPEPTSESTPVPEPTPTPFDPEHHPEYKSPEYDIWKVQYQAWKEAQDRLEAEKETQEDQLKQEKKERESVWEANDNDDAWVDSHGGNETYFVSGEWEADQAAAAATAASPQTNDLAANTSGFSDTFPVDTSPKPCSHLKTLDEGSSGDLGISAAGDAGSNEAVSEDIDSVSVANQNCASIENDSFTGSTSGENSQVGNDGDINTSTGPGASEGRVVNQGNTNATDADDLSNASAQAGDSFAQGSEAENLSTGEDTENFASATEVDNLSVDNSNEANVDNQMAVEATSGSNTIIDNDGSATLTTGDLELIANMLNILNLNITGEDFLHLIVNIFGNLNGNLDLDDIAVALGYKDDKDLEVIARNQDVGDDSVNEAIATKEENTDINNSNEAEVNNDMKVTGVSGGNDVSRNDGDVNVTTGRIRILANLMNFINTNFSGEKWSFIMVNIFGSLAGDIVLPDTKNYLEGKGEGVLAENIGAGDGSTSTSSASNIENTSVTNTNGVTLTNDVSASGTSGVNDQSNNDGPANGKTGYVDVSSKILNFLNLNITGNNWVFLIVNVFGKWMGQIVGFAGVNPFNVPQNGTFAALSVGSPQGEEDQPNIVGPGGENSTNTATASLERNANVNNENSAVVNNNMEVTGVSGANSLNKNDGPTTLRTGWIEIDANLLNIINMNVTGRKWMMVFLNIFGNFTGDLFFGKPPLAPILPVAMAQEAAPGNQFGTGGAPGDQSINSFDENLNETTNQAAKTETGAFASSQSRIIGRVKSKITINESSDGYDQEVSSEENITTIIGTDDSFQEENKRNFFEEKINEIHAIIFNLVSAFREIILSFNF